MSPRSRRSPRLRALSAVLIATQVAGSVPLWAAEAGPEPAPAAPPRAPITVNRTVPEVTPAPSSPVFSAQPTADELLRARVFGEPMVPTGEAPPEENRALAQALQGFLSGRAQEDFAPILGFLERHPQSPWRVALLTNLGTTYRDAGYLSRALDVWKQAWELGKDETDPNVKALADRALAEFLYLSMMFGRHQVLEEHLEAIEGRDIGGSAADKIHRVRRGLWLLKNKHEQAIPSGPTALDRILTHLDPKYVRDERIAAFHPTFDGASLDQMDGLAREVGLTMRMAFREGDADIPLPALIHMKVGHYSAVIREEGGMYLLHDPILGQEMWMSRQALREEASGYFVIPGRSLPSGWRAVKSEDAAKIRGKCAPCHQEHPGAMKQCQSTTTCGSCKGLAVASFHLLLTNLTINDSPVGYSPSRGPSAHFQVTYNHRESLLPAVFSFGNLGPKWTHNWTAYVQDNPAVPSASAILTARGGGYDIYTGFSGDSYAPHRETRAVLVRTSSSPVRYEHRMADGSVEVFAQSDGAATAPRRVFLTEVRDPLNQSMTFTYDASLRLVAVTDALGQVSTIAYEDADPLKITKVTDPFGRFATFQYTGGKLTRITDVIGLTSDFTYQATDFINTLTTPYGTSTFAFGMDGAQAWAEATDALGGKERIEYGYSTVLPMTDPPAAVPTGFAPYNDQVANYQSLHWTKRALMTRGPDHTAAYQSRWLIEAASSYIVPIPHSTKAPLENRVWYDYPGRSHVNFVGTMDSPSKVARVLDDGQSQLRQYEYNAKGMTIRAIDPVGRETVNVYGANNVPDETPGTGTGTDLLQTKVKNLASPGGWDVMSSSTYNAQGQSLTTTDAAGQVTTYTYDAQGRVTTIETPPRAGIAEDRTTTYSYDPATGEMSHAGGPGGVSASATYDAVGRVRTTTDPDGYVLTYDYDDLDREVRIIHPDGTQEETVFDRLRPVRRRDRRGRWSYTFHDALQRVVSTRDPAGHGPTQIWCACGDLERLVDPKGNATRWERDLQGRAIREVRVNGSTKEFLYEAGTGRLQTLKDPMGQETRFSYSLDDRLIQLAYQQAIHPTPSVNWSYTDPATNAPDAHGRLRKMTDSTGVTNYAFHPVTGTPSVGAGLIANVDGPYSNDTVVYAYDELGRVVSRTMNGVANLSQYDVLGRLTSMGDPTGTFTYGYSGSSNRIQTINYPNGQTSSYLYQTVQLGSRLQEIHHRRPGGATVARFTYAYGTDGNLETWGHQIGAGLPNEYVLERDIMGQLTAATYRSTTPTPAVLKRYRYGYDPAGNRTTVQIDGVARLATFDAMNRLIGERPGGTLSFEGLLSEPATVSANGVITQSVDGPFSVGVSVPMGTSQVAVDAADPTGNLRTNTYEITQAGASNAWEYDTNGNLTADGTRVYEWDAANRLVAVREGGATLASFTYDGNGRRATKTTNGNTTTYVYENDQFLEERSSAASTVRYVYGQRVDQPLMRVQGGVSAYYVADHLGSIVQTTDAAGMPLASWAYDPWGVFLAGTTSSGLAFVGREWDSEIELYYFRARYYSPALGRMISEDPVGVRVSPNLYTYVRNHPIDSIDPSGLIDMNLLSDKHDAREEPWAEARRVFESGYFTIAAHGNAQGVYISHGLTEHTLVTFNGLAEMIQLDPKFKCQPVKIFACKVAAKDEYITDLAEALKVEVTAPTKDIKFYISAPHARLVPGSKWRTCKPDGGGCETRK